MIGTFSALDLVLFYLFFEGGLIPMFLIIGVWGGPRRVYASFKFFLYTLLGSVLMLLAIMAMYWDAGTTDIPTLMHDRLPACRHADWLWLASLLLRGEDADVAGAHLAARRACGGPDRGLGDPGRDPAEDGRLWLPALLAADVPARLAGFAPLIFTLSVIAIIYTSLVALVQEDMKKLIAYSSVAHMGFVTMGIFAATRRRRGRHLPDDLARDRVGRAVPLRRRRLRPHAHPRDRRLWRARQQHADLCAGVHGVHLANVGLPGTSGFVGEFLALTRHLQGQPGRRRATRIGVILSAAYALWLYRKVIFGVIENAGARRYARPRLARSWSFAPLVILTILFGVYPKPVLDMSAASVAQLVAQITRAG